MGTRSLMHSAKGPLATNSAQAERIAALESEFEVRPDGQKVRKDRWEWGFRNIVTKLVGARTEFEIDEIVELVETRLGQSSKAEPQAGVELTDALIAAEAVRKSLAEKYQQGIDTNSADMGGNCDWARLEGAVKVVQALRALNQRQAVKAEPPKCEECPWIEVTYPNGDKETIKRAPDSFEVRSCGLRELRYADMEQEIYEDVYKQVCDMIEPYVQREMINPNGELPASVVDSVQILLEHWIEAKAPPTLSAAQGVPEGNGNAQN